jgi:hypothetical protein
MWRFSEIPQIIQVMDDRLSIDTHGDLGYPHYGKPLCVYIYILYTVYLYTHTRIDTYKPS